MQFQKLKIISPKRNSRLQSGWEGFFPYYAGFPEVFAATLLESAKLRPGSVVLDPWNGSGTTTFAAAQLGMKAVGFDINPVMIIVARARLLPPSEADSIRALAGHISQCAKTPRTSDNGDPLASWFAPETATVLRSFERSIRRNLVSDLVMLDGGAEFDRISGLAATLYVALFAVARKLASSFQASNPTWMRSAKSDDVRVSVSRTIIAQLFLEHLDAMARSLDERGRQPDLLARDNGSWEVRRADTTNVTLADASVDAILTSPPYCTRIDYAAATRIELAMLAPVLSEGFEQLGKRMIGSTRVPEHTIKPSADWGPTCLSFLRKQRRHQSKASSGYYYRTHLDYFDKMSKSINGLSRALKRGGVAFFVVQDSHYKEIHNDLPQIITEMCEANGLETRRRESFSFPRSMSSVNPHVRRYRRELGVTEAVLCLERV